MITVEEVRRAAAHRLDCEYEDLTRKIDEALISSAVRGADSTWIFLDLHLATRFRDRVIGEYGRQWIVTSEPSDLGVGVVLCLTPIPASVSPTTP
jgi:hypothetical protein